MKHYVPFLLLICSAFLLYFANAFFASLHLYYLLWWLDIPMHIASGVLAGLSVLLLSSFFHFDFKKSNTSVFIVSVSSALIVGLIWEIFSSVFGHVAPAFGGAVFDTAKDLLDDVLGGVLSGFIFLGKGYNNEHE